MANQYKTLAKHKGFVHLYQQLQVSRRGLMEAVVYGADGREEQLRGAIWALDSVIKLPDEMLKSGAEAEGVLRDWRE